MKIQAFVTIVAKDVNGDTVNVAPGKVGDIQQDVAERLIEQGFAEKAKKKDDVTSSAKAFGGARTALRKAAKAAPVAKQVTKGETEAQAKAAKKKRTRAELLGGDANSDADRNVGEDGRRFGEYGDKDSNEE